MVLVVHFQIVLGLSGDLLLRRVCVTGNVACPDRSLVVLKGIALRSILGLSMCAMRVRLLEPSAVAVGGATMTFVRSAISGRLLPRTLQINSSHLIQRGRIGVGEMRGW